MNRKKRTYNHNLIKKRRLYSSQDLAEIYKVHTGTVLIWVKKGLRPIETTKNPYYFMGEEIVRFLKETRRKRTHPLKPGEIFCTSCRMGRTGKANSWEIQLTGRMLGKNARQVLLYAKCETCNQRMILFSSDKRVDLMHKSGTLSKELETALIDNNSHSLNIGL